MVSKQNRQEEDDPGHLLIKSLQISNTERQTADTGKNGHYLPRNQNKQLSHGNQDKEQHL